MSHLTGFQLLHLSKKEDRTHCIDVILKITLENTRDSLKTLNKWKDIWKTDYFVIGGGCITMKL